MSLLCFLHSFLFVTLDFDQIHLCNQMLNPVFWTMGGNYGLAVLVGVAILLEAVQCQVSCKGADGERGVNGAPGRNGLLGMKGEKGEPGNTLLNAQALTCLPHLVYVLILS